MPRHPNHQPNRGNLPERRSIRRKGYDYSREGFYFISLICYERRHYFGFIQNGTMCLNDFGTIVFEEWFKTSQLRPNITLGEFIVMPNHIHGIIHIKESEPSNHEDSVGKFRSPSHTIGAIIRGVKGAVTRRIRAYILNLEKGKTKTINRATPYVHIPSKIGLVNLEKSVWQRDYYDIIIRDELAHHNITKYIRNNPQKWTEDRFYKESPSS